MDGRNLLVAKSIRLFSGEQEQRSCRLLKRHLHRFDHLLARRVRRRNHRMRVVVVDSRGLKHRARSITGAANHAKQHVLRRNLETPERGRLVPRKEQRPLGGLGKSREQWRRRRRRCSRRRRWRRLDVRFQLRPAGEAVVARERVQGVGERGVGIALTHRAQQRLRLLLQVFEIGATRKIARHDSSLMPGVRRWGSVPKDWGSDSDHGCSRWDDPFPRTGCTLDCGRDRNAATASSSNRAPRRRDR